MWVPEPMTHFLLAATEEDLPEVLDFIGKQGRFHIEEFSHRFLHGSGYEETYGKLENCEQRIEEIIEYFDIKSTKKIPLRAVEVDEVIAEAEDFLEEFQNKLGERKNRLGRLKKEEKELNLTSELLVLLPESDTPIEELRESKFLKMWGGTIPSSEEENLLEITKDREIIVFRRKALNERVPIILFYSSYEEESLDRVLESVRFTQLEFFNRLEGPLLNLKDRIENKFWEIKEERASLRASVKKMGRNVEEKILELRNNIRVSLLELKWLGKMAKSEKVFFISTYLPSRNVSGLKEKGENLNLYILNEENIERKDDRANETPTKLNNPSMLRPFEFLIKAYDVPSYRGIDPTIPTVLTFMFLFGIMFGDLGHGLVLILIGGVLYSIKLLRRFALFPVLLGISSSIFGTFFGEFFGVSPFKPLWFSPFEDPERAMLLALYLGIVMVTIGFILRLVEFIMEKNKEKLLLSGHGLPGFLFYLFSLALAFSIINGKGDKIIAVESLAMGVSALVVAGGIPLKNAIGKGMDSNKLLISIGELIHLSLAMVSNTLSFIRVAAFNIGHIILTMSIIEIANMIGDMVGIGNYTTLIFGNILIIALEGMIIFIQGLRLEYYELYSRFFERGKEMYEPVKIK